MESKVKGIGMQNNSPLDAIDGKTVVHVVVIVFVFLVVYHLLFHR